MSTNVIPVIQAMAEYPNFHDTLASRISRIKVLFGLPHWVTGERKPRQLPPEVTLRPRRSPSRELPSLNLTIMGRPKAKASNPHGVFVIDPPPATSLGSSALIKELIEDSRRTASVVARAEIAQLAQPATINTKSRILAWMETPEDKTATLADMYAEFPDVARKGLSSRVSELVHEGSLIRLSHGTYGLPVVV